MLAQLPYTTPSTADPGGRQGAGDPGGAFEGAFDVPEWFDDPRQLLLRLVWGRELSFDESAALHALEAVFAAHGVGGRVELRHRRFLWKAVVD